MARAILHAVLGRVPAQATRGRGRHREGHRAHGRRVDRGRATAGGGGVRGWVDRYPREGGRWASRAICMHERGMSDSGTKETELLAATKRLGVRGRYIQPDQV